MQDMNILAGDGIRNYYQKIAERVDGQFALAKSARAKNYDVCSSIESLPAVDLADRAETIIGPKGVAARYRELYAKHNNRELAIFDIFRDIISGKLGNLPGNEKRVEQAIKTSLCLITEGVVVAPIDGLPYVRISKNPDGSEYVDVYYAGPIRAAGGTAQVLPLILGDYARALLSLDRYKPTEAEVERYVEEVKLYSTLYTRQYPISEEEIRTIIRGCPVCINGEPTEKLEVSVFRDLQRIPSNRIRGGACLVISDGIALKAMAILNYAKMLQLDWSWLEKIIKVKKSGEKESGLQPSKKYLEGIAAGRPILAYPLRFGGFRLRYGKSRNNGIMGKCIHPATMAVLDEFIAVGTQMKIERPGKSAGIFPCDSIEGPIVKLKDGSVVQLHTYGKAKELSPNVEKILFLGDLLVTYGDFKKSAHPLVPAGYCEEWWLQEVKKALGGNKNADAAEFAKIMKNPFDADYETAIKVSEILNVPLHPHYIHYYSALQKSEMLELIDAIRSAEVKELGGEMKIKNSSKTKECLERIGLPHSLSADKARIIVDSEFAPALLKTFGFYSKKVPAGENALEILNSISDFAIRDKGGTFIGARMGRPESAKPRVMVGNPHVLFPVGLYGGATRSLNKAMDSEEDSAEHKYRSKEAKMLGEIEVEIAYHKCPNCGKILPSSICSQCRCGTKKITLCEKCGTECFDALCRNCRGVANSRGMKKINIDELMRTAAMNLGMGIPETVKGVRGVINDDKFVEPLEKGILRARHDLHVFRDATIRFDLLNAPLTHFKPSEIELGVEEAKRLGYAKDMDGKELASPEQMLELMPQDIIINESAAEFFLRATKFIDDLLEDFYGLERYYKANSKQDLIGELVLGLAPHTSAAIVGRIIGYTKARVCFAHPFFHLTKRRNIDGDQDSILLLMDALLNFSQKYLPSTRGARMDAPLVFTIALKPSEIDNEAFDMEVCGEYPLELYEKALRLEPANLEGIERVYHRLNTERQYSGLKYTHETTCFDEGPKISRYVQLDTMAEKLNAQAELQQKIVAIEHKDALERVMASHFLPDLIGNTRAFSRQNFRCTKCNTRYRRIPLVGHCTKCGGNIILTIAEGSARKYLEIAKAFILKYALSPYIKQRVDLIEREMNSVFQSEGAVTKQKSLAEFV